MRGCLRAAGTLAALRPTRGRLRAAALVAVLVGAAWGGVAVWRSSLLEIKSVEVTGTSSVAVEEVVARAGLAGRHMVTADLGTAQREVTAIPLVRSVRVERHWPNTVVFHVEERVPWGTWDQAGVQYAIDREGVVLGTFAAPPGAPLVISADPVSLRQGDRVSYQAVDAVAEIYDLLPRELGTGVHQVAFVPGKGVEVVTDDGQVALLGDSSSIAYKLAVWAAAEEEAARQRINYRVIDLRWGNRPVLQ